jgi:hypothetical protein
MRNVPDKPCRENETHVFNVQKLSKHRAIYEIMSKNVVEPERPQRASHYGAYKLHVG